MGSWPPSPSQMISPPRNAALHKCLFQFFELSRVSPRQFNCGSAKADPWVVSQGSLSSLKAAENLQYCIYFSHSYLKQNEVRGGTGGPQGLTNLCLPKLALQARTKSWHTWEFSHSSGCGDHSSKDTVPVKNNITPSGWQSPRSFIATQQQESGKLWRVGKDSFCSEMSYSTRLPLNGSINSTTSQTKHVAFLACEWPPRWQWRGGDSLVDVASKSSRSKFQEGNDDLIDLLTFSTISGEILKRNFEGGHFLVFVGIVRTPIPFGWFHLCAFWQRSLLRYLQWQIVQPGSVAYRLFLSSQLKTQDHDKIYFCTSFGVWFLWKHAHLDYRALYCRKRHTPSWLQQIEQRQSLLDSSTWGKYLLDFFSFSLSVDQNSFNENVGELERLHYVNECRKTWLWSRSTSKATPWTMRVSSLFSIFEENLPQWSCCGIATPLWLSQTIFSILFVAEHHDVNLFTCPQSDAFGFGLLISLLVLQNICKTPRLQSDSPWKCRWTPNKHWGKSLEWSKFVEKQLSTMLYEYCVHPCIPYNTACKTLSCIDHPSFSSCKISTKAFFTFSVNLFTHANCKLFWINTQEFLFEMTFSKYYFPIAGDSV